MMSLLTSVVMLTCTAGEGQAAGVLYQPAFTKENVLLEPARYYIPQAGDLFICNDHLIVAKLGHIVAGASSPHHSGLMFQHPSGKVAMLEGGPHNGIKTRVLDLEKNLTAYEAERVPIWIRRRMVPLTAEQSKKLTDWAMAQDGKKFGWGRMLLQMTPVRTRGPVRTYHMGEPHGYDREAFYCAELVMESLVMAGLCDPAKTRPSATFPSDIFWGTSANPFLKENLELNKAWEPPARWFSHVPVKK